MYIYSLYLYEESFEPRVFTITIKKIVNNFFRQVILDNYQYYKNPQAISYRLIVFASLNQQVG